jgi:molybdate transport system substrate-binding protein
MKTILFLLISLLSLQAGSIRVAIAANVGYAMPDLVKAFESRHPDTHVDTLIGGSGKLAAQIQRGAPFDLFLSANMAYPIKLHATGDAVSPPCIYAQGALVMLGTHAHDFSRGLGLLTDSAIARIAIPNPRTAPYGKAAFDALTHAKLLETLRPKFVYGESISQTVTYTQKAADIGLIAKSALYAPQMRTYKEGTHWREVDPVLYTPIDQGMVLLKRAANNPEAKAFYDFLLGDEARAIFVRYGYRLP